MRIVFVGGGTGGHFYPLIAVAEAIVAEAKGSTLILPEMYYMGPDPYDQGSLFASGITFVKCPAGKVRTYWSVRNITDGFKTLAGFFVALWRLFVLYPDVIMSKGGYTSVPIILAARILRIPIVVHESDAVPGRANKLAARFAEHVAISYPEAARFFPKANVALTGIPVRRELLVEMSEHPHSVLGISPGRPLIVIVGGSQGAERINELIVSALDTLLAEYEIIHQTGVANLGAVEQMSVGLVSDKEKLTHYHPKSFLDVNTLHAAYSAAALVISRAGSTSIHEIALHGKPSILIPLPEDISRDQRSNAYAYARTKAAVVMEEKNMTPNLLYSEITRIMGDAALQIEMEAAAQQFAPRDASVKIASVLLQIGLEHEQ